jgi:translation elongation factor EF-Ts
MVNGYIMAAIAMIGENIRIGRFAHFQIGESQDQFSKDKAFGFHRVNQ